jgi:hypothetical protein
MLRRVVWYKLLIYERTEVPSSLGSSRPKRVARRKRFVYYLECGVIQYSAVGGKQTERMLVSAKISCNKRPCFLRHCGARRYCIS